MKNLIMSILAVLVLALGALCLMQWKDARAGREQLRAVEAARASEMDARETQAARIESLELNNQRLQQQIQQFAGLTTQLRSNDVRQSSNLLALAQQMRAPLRGSAGVPADGAAENGPLSKGMGETLGKMMKNPAMREMIRDQQKSVINMMYGGLFKDMNLTAEEKDKLKGILSESQLKNIELAQGMFGGGDVKESAGDATKQITDAKSKADADVKALLGEERYAQYQDYQKTMGERMQLDQFKSQLPESAPLGDDQAKQLLQLMQDEKSKVPPVIPSDQTQVPRKDMFTAENLDKQLKWTEDYNRRVLDGAGRILSPEQLQQFQSFQEQQASMQKLGLQMAKGLFSGDKTGAPAEPTPAPIPVPVPVPSK